MLLLNTFLIFLLAIKESRNSNTSSLSFKESLLISCILPSVAASSSISVMPTSQSSDTPNTFAINLIDYLRSIRAPVVKLLREGESEKVLRHKFEGKGLTATQEIIEVYKIVDGTSMNEDYLGLQYFFPEFILVSIDQALELYEEECIEYGSWPEGYIPIFWNGNRDYLLVDSLNGNNGVYYFSPDEFRFDGLGKIYDSLDLLFTTVLECFKQGGYALGNQLENINYKAEIVNALSRKMNPSSEFRNFAEEE